MRYETDRLLEAEGVFRHILPMHSCLADRSVDESFSMDLIGLETQINVKHHPGRNGYDFTRLDFLMTGQLAPWYRLYELDVDK